VAGFAAAEPAAAAAPVEPAGAMAVADVSAVAAGAALVAAMPVSAAFGSPPHAIMAIVHAETTTMVLQIIFCSLRVGVRLPRRRNDTVACAPARLPA
jgi:hypothetical protein